MTFKLGTRGYASVNTKHGKYLRVYYTGRIHTQMQYAAMNSTDVIHNW